jgi:[methyl-Co(III) methanol-specific corrinoid protein]:coenzyme M methyltransferase
MNLKELFLHRLQGRDSDKTPVGCTTTYGVIDFMRKCGFERPLADTDPQAMTELAYAGHQYGGFEWVKAMGWDITALSEALGCRLGQPLIDRQFHIKSHPFANNLDGLVFPRDFLDRGRFPAYRSHLELLKRKVGDTLAIFGETEGAFTCAANLVGLEQLLKLCLRRSDAVYRLFEVTKQAAIAAANFAFRNGVDYFVFAEPTSGPALASPALYEQFILPLEREIFCEVQGPVVLHVCGNADSIVQLMCSTGACGISIEEKSDLRRAVETAHSRGIKVFGNVSSSAFRLTPGDVYREAVNALQSGTDFLCPGCGLPPDARVENIFQLKNARDDFGADSGSLRPVVPSR